MSEVRVGRRLPRLIILACWCVAALWLAWHHVPWRDEVRALTIALSGDTTLDMLRNLHGEGHPAIWYLLLRWAHALIQSPLVLPVTAFIISSAGMTLLALRSPLPLTVIALFMFGGLGLFEYTVSARNYGIAMTFLFAFTALYPRWRDRGVAMGLLLFLLCNTSVPACFLAAALLGFWLFEVVSEEGLRRHRKYLIWALNAAVAAAGAALCFITVFPTVHDAASISHPEGLGLSALLHAVSPPLFAFPELAAPFLLDSGMAGLLLALGVGGSLAGLLRVPAAFLAAFGLYAVFSLFFQLVYPGGYRHQGLLIVFLMTMYWLVAAGRGGHWPVRWELVPKVASIVSRPGILFLMLLLGLQLLPAARHVRAALEDVPYSRVRDLAALLEREGLTNATIIGHPDVFAEPLLYYAANPVWLLREQKFGHVVRFTSEGRVDLRLDDITNDAERIARETGRPVVIAIKYHLNPDDPPRRIHEGYLGYFHTDPEQVRRFLAATRKLAEFEPAITDERYDVYVVPGG